ncbi:MAG: lysylphosphatidylglycerol synthase transmembrane domain-containing protein [Candidatus Bathyarchaeia archaeon]
MVTVRLIIALKLCLTAETTNLSAIKYLSTRKAFFFMFIGLSVFVLYLYFFAGFKRIVVVLSGVNPMQYALFYSLAIGAVLLGNFFWLLSWRKVLNTLHVKISLKNAFLYYWTGYFVDLIVPCETVCGEVTRLYLVHKETDDDYGVIAAGGVTNRIIAYIIVVTGLYASAGLLFLKANIPLVILSVFIFILIGASLYLVVLLYLAFSQQAAGKLAKIGLKVMRALRPKKYGSSDLSEDTKKSLAAFYTGFKTFREKPRHLVVPFFYLTLAWIFNLTQYILVFYALGIFNESFAFFIIIYFVAGSLTDAAASFSVGTLDILLASIFVLYGLSPALSGITAALVRSVTFWSPLIIGYVMVQILGGKRMLGPRVNEAKAVVAQKASG